jgi:hypothetical protein
VIYKDQGTSEERGATGKEANERRIVIGHVGLSMLFFHKFEFLP